MDVNVTLRGEGTIPFTNPKDTDVCGFPSVMVRLIAEPPSFSMKPYTVAGGGGGGGGGGEEFDTILVLTCLPTQGVQPSLVKENL